MQKMLKKKIYAKERIGLVLLLAIITIAHGYNMWHSPYLENDEGIYPSRAWAILNQGKLDIYTYWYDHAPAGWLLMAGWAAITGGFETFGLAVKSLEAAGNR